MASAIQELNFKFTLFAGGYYIGQLGLKGFQRPTFLSVTAHSLQSLPMLQIRKPGLLGSKKKGGEGLERLCFLSP